MRVRLEASKCSAGAGAGAVRSFRVRYGFGCGCGLFFEPRAWVWFEHLSRVDNLKVSTLRSITVSFSTQVFQKCKFQHLSAVESFSTQASKSVKFQHSGRNKFQHSNFSSLDL